MAGNSARRGAVRRPGSKKGAKVGSGGQRRKGLEAKGPTPKAEERTGHPAARKARRDAEAPGRRGQPPAGSPGGDTSDLVVGRNPVVEALRAQLPAVQLLVVDLIDPEPRVVEAVALATARGVPVKERPKRELDRLAGSSSHQGLVLQAEPFAYADLDDLLATGSSATGSSASDTSATGSSAADASTPEATSVGSAEAPPILVATDAITDPHNLGAIARSAAAFGASGLLVPSRRSAPVTAAAWRSSAGAFAHLPTARVTNLARALGQAKSAGYFVVALDGGADSSVGEVARHFRDVPVLLVVGSEGAGVSRLTAERADALARIDMPGRAESLNASVAAGIALYALSQARENAGAAGERAKKQA